MKKKVRLLPILALFLLMAGSAEQRPGPWRPASNGPLPPNPARQPDFGDVPLYFIQNQGQVDGQALFYADASSYRLWLTGSGLVFESWAGRGADIHDVRSAVSMLAFLNANPAPAVKAVDPSDFRVNYLIGDDPARWKVDLPTSRAVVYKGLYDRIDLKVYGIEREIEYDWVVHPGGRIGDIRFAYRDFEKTRIDADGNLVVETGCGTIVHRRPDSFQVVDGRKVHVEAAFVEAGPGEYGFRIGVYDPGRDLFIDPLVLAFSTFLGGSGKDWGRALAVDAQGALYVTGMTDSTDFPVKSARQTGNGGGLWDIFLTKFAPGGKSLVFSTYIGGSRIDAGRAIALGKDGSIYLAGETESPNFPLKNPIQDEILNERSDAFALRLTKDGKGLVYSTFLGGPDQDFGYGIAADGDGNAVVVGSCGKGFPVKNAIQSTFRGGIYDGFVSKIVPKGGDFIFSSYLGGGGIDNVNGVVLNARGEIYLTGQTPGKGFPVHKAFQKTFGGGTSDAFFLKLSPSGQAFDFCSFLGGAGLDFGSSIALGPDDTIYIAGETASADFPVKTPYQKTNRGDEDGFLTKLAADGQSPVYSTYIGGKNMDRLLGVAVDPLGYASVAGYSDGGLFPVSGLETPAAYPGLQGIMAVFKPDGRSLVGSRCLGGSELDRFYGIAADGKGGIYVTGESWSSNFPVKNALQPKKRLYGDAVVLKFTR